MSSEALARAAQGDTLSGSIDNYTTVASGHVSELEGWIAAEETAENTAVSDTNASIQAQEDRLAALQDAGANFDSFAEIVALANSLSGSDATALSQEVATVVSDLGTLTTNRTDGDTDESDYLTNSVIVNRTTDIAAMGNLIANAEQEFTDDETAFTAFLAVEKTSLQGDISTYEAGTLASEEAAMTLARTTADNNLSSSISSQVVIREGLISTESTARADGDAALNTRLDNLETSWSGDSMTLTGQVSVGGDLDVGGEMKLGVHTSVPAGYASGDQAGNNGAMFYLNAADDANRTGFEKGYSWYFCEDSVWFASPFDNE